MAELEKVRIDKWLWSVRIFKTRTIASDACRSGKIKVNNVSVKPSYLLQIGDHLQVRKNNFNLQFKVRQLIQKRVSAELARPCYEDLTPEEELNKFQDWYIGKSGAEKRSKGAGRPTKKERRTLDTYKNKN